MKVLSTSYPQVVRKYAGLSISYPQIYVQNLCEDYGIIIEVGRYLIYEKFTEEADTTSNFNDGILANYFCWRPDFDDADFTA